MATAALSSPTSSRYCRTCGDAVASTRILCARCNSRGEPSTRSNMTALSNRRTDPWVSRYASDISASQALSDETTVGTGEEVGKQGEQERISVVEAKEDKWLRSSRYPTTTTAYSLGAGMPSSISRDLRLSSTASTSNPLMSQRMPASSRLAQSSTYPGSDSSPSSSNNEADESSGSLPALKERLSHMPHSPSQPLLQHTSGGVLSKVCGSVIEPASSRNKWACADCSLIFARDSTVYVPPASAVKQGATNKNLYCKVCYTNRYALGICASSNCKKPVLGSTKEYGAYVKAAAGTLYHGTCFRCHSCDVGGGQPPHGDGIEIMLDMEGRPSCEDCFGAAPRRRQVVTRNQPQSGGGVATALSPTLGSTVRHESKGEFPLQAGARNPSPSKPKGQDTKLKATINELSQKFAGPKGQSAEEIVKTQPISSESMSTSNSPTRRPLSHFPQADSGKAEVQSRDRSLDVEVRRTTMLEKRNSRSRSLSPFKATTIPSATTNSVAPSLTASPAKTHTSGGFPLPRNFRDAEEQIESTTSPLRPSRAGNGGSDSDAEHQASEQFQEMKRSSSKSDISPLPSEIICAACGKEPFDGPNVTGEVATMVTLPASAACRGENFSSPSHSVKTTSSPIHLHLACFRCNVCKERIDASRAFVRLDEDYDKVKCGGLSLFAHPQCAPPARLTPRSTVDEVGREENGVRITSLGPPVAAPVTATAAVSTQHPTLRNLPRPGTTDGEGRKHVAVHSFIRRANSYRAEEKMKRSENDQKGILSNFSEAHDGLYTSGERGRSGASPERCTPLTTWHSSIASKGQEGANRFKATSGASPPTRSTLNGHRPAAGKNPAAGMFSTNSYSYSNRFDGSLSPSPTIREEESSKERGKKDTAGTHINSSVVVSSSAPSSTSTTTPTTSSSPPPPTPISSRYGGMQTCSGCSGRLTSLESIPGPAGSNWHRKCLICKGQKSSVGVSYPKHAGGVGAYCGKQLDSFAKVRGADGAVRCAECFRAGR